MGVLLISSVRALQTAKALSDQGRADRAEVFDRCASLSAAVRSANIRAVRQVNAELVTLYWNIGRIIRERQTTEGWGTKVVDRLASDLRHEFPSMTGLSSRNLNYMLQFATDFTEPIVQQVVAQLPWGHVTVLLPLSDEPGVRLFYATRCAQEGWSRSALFNQIKSQLHLRLGAAPSNFAAVEPPESSELVSQLIKDPYNFEFLTLASDAPERDVEHGLVANLAKTLQELGVGFYYVGRQHRLTLTDSDGQVDEFFLDLLFYHHLLRRFVVFELKIDKFRPEYAGKLNFYCNVVDDQLRHYDGIDGPTIGILLCARSQTWWSTISCVTTTASTDRRLVSCSAPEVKRGGRLRTTQHRVADGRLRVHLQPAAAGTSRRSSFTR